MKKKSGKISPSKLIELLSEQLSDLPDKRTGENTKYEVKEAVMGAFSVFFTQSGSFLENQRIMKENKGKNNAKSLSPEGRGNREQATGNSKNLSFHEDLLAVCFLSQSMGLRPPPIGGKGWRWVQSPVTRLPCSLFPVPCCLELALVKYLVIIK